MKLRIRENSIRLRLTQSEVAEFAENGFVENKTEFGGDVNFGYAISANDQTDSLNAEFANGKIQVVVPKALADQWANSEDVGIEGTFEALSIIIEKDFACLNVRDGEDESDAFPHPKEKELSC